MRYMGAYPGVGACPGHYGNIYYTRILFSCEEGALEGESGGALNVEK